jgi:phasin family protein
MQQMIQEALLATPPKSTSRKSGAKSAPVAAKAAVAATPPKPKPVVKAKPVTVPKAAVPVVKAEPVKVEPVPAPEPVAVIEPTPAPEPVAVMEPVVAEALPVEWPVAAMPVAPEPEISNPALADVDDLPPVAAAINMKGNIIMTDVMETAKTYAEEAKTRIQSAFVEANDKAKAALEKSSKAFEELGELTKGNLEAVVESSKIAAKGVESLSQEAAEFGRKSFEKTSSTMKSFAAVKTPAEFFQLQSDLLSATLDSFASEASKSSEAFLKLASDISTPISNRVSVVTEKMKSLAA